VKSSDYNADILFRSKDSWFFTLTKPPRKFTIHSRLPVLSIFNTTKKRVTTLEFYHQMGGFSQCTVWYYWPPYPQEPAPRPVGIGEAVVAMDVMDAMAVMVAAMVAGVVTVCFTNTAATVATAAATAAGAVVMVAMAAVTVATGDAMVLLQPPRRLRLQPPL
jgi:hypothetical protein